MVKKKVTIFLQNLTWLLSDPFISFFLRYRIIYRSKWRPHQIAPPALLVANHRSFFDHIFMSLSFPRRPDILPLGFLVAKAYTSVLKKGPLAVLINFGGGVPVTRTIPGKKSLADVLAGAEKVLAEKRILVIFPEGKRVRHNIPVRGGRGAAYLAMKHQIPLVPFFIEGSGELTIWKTLTRQNKITLYVGEPFSVKGDYNNDGDLRRATELILKEIRLLSQ